MRSELLYSKLVAQSSFWIKQENIQSPICLHVISDFEDGLFALCFIEKYTEMMEPLNYIEKFECEVIIEKSDLLRF